MKKVMNNHTLRMQRTIFKHSNKQVFGNTDSNETRPYIIEQMKHIQLKRGPTWGKMKYH